MQLTELATYDNSLEANLVVTRLESEGIPAFLHNEHFSTLFPKRSNMLGTGVRIVVPADRLEESRELIAPARQPEACVYCSSANIREVSDNFNLLRILRIVFISILAGTASSTKYRCGDCGQVSNSNN